MTRFQVSVRNWLSVRVPARPGARLRFVSHRAAPGQGTSVAAGLVGRCGGQGTGTVTVTVRAGVTAAGRDGHCPRFAVTLHCNKASSTLRLTPTPTSVCPR
jgi:hypothetical protein